MCVTAVWDRENPSTCARGQQVIRLPAGRISGIQFGTRASASVAALGFPTVRPRAWVLLCIYQQLFTLYFLILFDSSRRFLSYFFPLLFFTSGSCCAPPSCCEPCGTATASTYYFLFFFILFFLPKNWCNPLPLPLPLSDSHHSFSIFFVLHPSEHCSSCTAQRSPPRPLGGQRHPHSLSSFNIKKLYDRFI